MTKTTVTYQNLLRAVEFRQREVVKMEADAAQLARELQQARELLQAVSTYRLDTMNDRQLEVVEDMLMGRSPVESAAQRGEGTFENPSWPVFDLGPLVRIECTNAQAAPDHNHVRVEARLEAPDVYTSERRVEMYWGWAVDNPGLFTQSCHEFYQLFTPDVWDLSVDNSRRGLLVLIAKRRQPPTA